MRSYGYHQFQKMASKQRRMSRGNSRVTISSKRSVNSNSSIIVARKSASYKRSVSFAHNRDRATSGRRPRLRTKEHGPSPFTLHQKYLQDQALPTNNTDDEHSIPKSPALLPPASREETPQDGELCVERRRRSPTKPVHPQSRDPGRTLSQYVTHDARKVSTELAQLCDESWNRDSITTIPTASTPATDPRISQQSYTSPATSFTLDDESNTPLPPLSLRQTPNSLANTHRDGPSSPLPSDRPAASEFLGTQTKNEIAKTRDLLKERARDSCMAPGYLDEVIAHLDRLMQPSQIRLANEERRAISTPDPGLGIPRRDTFEQILEKNHIGYRAASEPAKRGKAGHQSSTVRLVEGDEYNALSPIQPLTIRKKSSSSGPSSGSRTPTQQTFPQHTFQPQHPPPGQRSAGLTLLDNQGLDPITENEDKENFDPTDRLHKVYIGGQQRKRNWFGRHQHAKPSRATDIAPPPLPAQRQRPPSDCQILEGQSHLHDVGNVIPKVAKKPPISGKGRFLKLFASKKDGKNIAKRAAEGGGDYDIDDTASQFTEESSSTRQHAHHITYLPSHQHHGSSTFLQKRKGHPKHATHPSNSATLIPHPQNWLARFLRIKPATRTLCFQVSKLRVRKEISIIFRDWKKHGMHSIHIDKSTSRIWASVAAENSLKIPAMGLAVEVHEVLFRGRRANLSIARCTQARGAK
ncbi:MAG: hypothetical protein Q9164_004555, partial [Protoblastenia rupestris]